MIEIKDADLLRMQPGDVLVIKYPGVMSLEQRKYIREMVLKPSLPDGVKTLVLDHGMTFSVLRPENSTEVTALNARAAA